MPEVLVHPDAAPNKRKQHDQAPLADSSRPRKQCSPSVPATPSSAALPAAVAAAAAAAGAAYAAGPALHTTLKGPALPSPINSFSWQQQQRRQQQQQTTLLSTQQQQQQCSAGAVAWPAAPAAANMAGSSSTPPRSLMPPGHAAAAAATAAAATAAAAAAAAATYPQSLLVDDETDLGQGCAVSYYPAVYTQQFFTQQHGMLPPLPPRQSMFDVMLQKLRMFWGRPWLWFPELDSSGQPIVLRGKIVWESRRQPRDICYMADDASLTYRYAGHTLKPEPSGWSPEVAAIKEDLETLCGCSFNSCLLNYYRDSSDNVMWHQDRHYGPTTTIASVSFGASREFLLRPLADKQHVVGVVLSDGDVLVMSGETQQHWEHCVPQCKEQQQQKQQQQQQGRISLTFRYLPPGSKQ